MGDEPRWTDDISVLWRNPTQFFPVQPTRNMTLNSTTRFLLYAGVALSVFHRSATPMIVSIILSILLSMVYWRQEERELAVELVRKQGCRKPSRENPFMNAAVHEFGTPTVPCDENVDSEVSDALFSTYVYSTADDVFGDEFARRPFIRLPNGGTHPDFSKLATELRPTHS
jgi:hypothetical protein